MPLDHREDAGRFLDLDTWPRASVFHFFLQYEQPFFNVCAEVDVTETRRFCREREISFFLAYLYLCLRACNGTEPLRYRLRGKRVWVHDRLFMGTTVAMEDRSFRFGYFDWAEEFGVFRRGAEQTLERVRDPSKPLEDLWERDDLIHGSVLPWVCFTSIAHARRLPAKDSVPKIVFGKCGETDQGLVSMPVSIEAHHALVDGIDVADWLRRFEEGLAEPERTLAES